MGVTATIGAVSADGYVWAPGQAGALTEQDMQYHGVACAPLVKEQGSAYIPAGFDYANAGVEQEGGVVQIS